MDQLLPRDELVVSQLPRASMKEKKQHCVLHTEARAKAKLQEVFLEQNTPCQEHKERGRGGQEAPTTTWGCGGTGLLWAGLEGALTPHFRSCRDQLWQLLQVLNGICDLPRTSTVSAFLGTVLFPQFTRRQRKISISPPPCIHPHSKALPGCILAKIPYSIKSTLYFLYNSHRNLQA